MRLSRGDSLVLATHNSGKVRELSALLAPFGVKVLSPADFGLTEPAETESTFLGNARIKARAALDGSGLPALADDSGLEVAGLDGAPGVYSADWAETGDGRDFPRAMARVRDELVARDAPEPWSARFLSVLCFLGPDGSEAVFEGAVDGRIVWPPRGDGGFGYDPIFVPEDQSLTFGEMSVAEKQALSHRARAFAKFVEGCLG